MIRYIVFDTETTGLDPFSGDKLIELGAVEMLGKQKTGRTYHQLINPQKPLSQEIIDITHITNDMLADKPIFNAVADDFLNFINNSQASCVKTCLVAHNASFDIKFLNYEFKQIGKHDWLRYEVIETLELARRRFPGQKATLDMLCEKFEISLEERRKEGHGALLDSQILADVFVKLIEGNDSSIIKDDLDFVGIKKRDMILPSRHFYATDEELKIRQQFLIENNIDDS